MQIKRPVGRKIATLKDVAREAGVSIAAVSYSLNGAGTISEEVRARVFEIADRLGYRPNRSAQLMRTGRNTTIGLLMPDLRNPYFPALAQTIEHAARQAGYTVMLIDTSSAVDSELEGMRHLEQQGVAGAIWCQTSNEDLPENAHLIMPIVVLGSPSEQFDSVATDDTDGGRQAARYLLDLGHRRFGILSGAPIKESQDARINAFVAALSGNADVMWRKPMSFSIEPSREIIDLLVRRDVTAIMCGNDLIAIAVLRAARQLGIGVPADLSVVGFDDIPWASIVTPTLATIRQPVDEMASAAFDLLMDRLSEPDRDARHLRVDVQLIVRDSVGAVSPLPRQVVPGR